MTARLVTPKSEVLAAVMGLLTGEAGSLVASRLPTPPILAILTVAVGALTLSGCKDYRRREAVLKNLAAQQQAGPPWVLRGRTQEESVYLDSSRIEWKLPDSAVGVWLRFDSDQPLGPPSPPSKRVDMHFTVNCAHERVQMSRLEVYDPAGRMQGHDFAPQEMASGTFPDKTFSGYAGVLRSSCAWLSDRTTPPVIVDTGR